MKSSSPNKEKKEETGDSSGAAAGRDDSSPSSRRDGANENASPPTHHHPSNESRLLHQEEEQAVHERHDENGEGVAVARVVSPGRKQENNRTSDDETTARRIQQGSADKQKTDSNVTQKRTGRHSSKGKKTNSDIRLEHAPTIGPSGEQVSDQVNGNQVRNTKERFAGETIQEPTESETSSSTAEIVEPQPGAVAVPGTNSDASQGAGWNSVAESHPPSRTMLADPELGGGHDLMIHATMVEESEYVHAIPIPQYCAKLKEHKYKLSLVVLVLVAVGVVLVIVLPSWSSSSSSPSPTQASPLPPTLASVKDRGVFRCGVQSKLGFSEMDESSGEMQGFEVDLCRAVAAAVLGPSYILETKVIAASERFPSVANGSLDMVASAATITMERDVFEVDSNAGVSFSVPYLYDGLGFGGVPPFGSCANSVDTLGECAGLKVCVEAGTTHTDVLMRVFPSSNIVVRDSDRLVFEGLVNGDCNAIAGEQFNIAEGTVRSEGYNGPYEVGSNLYSKEPLGLVTRDGDEEWADFANLVLQALFEAETRNITKDSATDFGETDVFGDEYTNMFINAIAEVGNYAELYNRHLESIVARQPVNMINTEPNATGVIYSLPFGSVLRSPGGPGPVPGGRLEHIVQRGNLRCAVVNRPGFAQFDQVSGVWSGLDVDYCRALSASIFGGVFSTIDFVEVLDMDAGFKALADGDVDVFAGGSATLEKDVGDSTSGRAFSFSQPYFYDTTDSDSIPKSIALVSLQGDEQWSSFVYWIVSSTFYAEEEGITRQRSNDMTEVNLFGPQYGRMLRDAILAVGNYGEMYERSVQAVIPRSGRNQLNTIPLGPQHYQEFADF